MNDTVMFVHQHLGIAWRPPALSFVSLDLLTGRIDILHLLTPVNEGAIEKSQAFQAISNPEVSLGSAAESLKIFLSNGQLGAQSQARLAFSTGDPYVPAFVVAALSILARAGICSVPFSFETDEHDQTRIRLQGAGGFASLLPLTRPLLDARSTTMCESYASLLFGPDPSTTHLAYVAAEISCDRALADFLDSAGEVQSSHDVVHFLQSASLSKPQQDRIIEELRHNKLDTPSEGKAHVRTDAHFWAALRDATRGARHHSAVVSGFDIYSMEATEGTNYAHIDRIPLKYAVTRRRNAALAEHDTKKIALLSVCRERGIKLSFCSALSDIQCRQLLYFAANCHAFKTPAFPETLNDMNDYGAWWARMIIDQDAFDARAAPFVRKIFEEMTKDGRSFDPSRPIMALAPAVSGDEFVISPVLADTISPTKMTDDEAIRGRFQQWRGHPRFPCELFGSALVACEQSGDNSKGASDVTQRIIQSAFDALDTIDLGSVRDGAAAFLIDLCAHDFQKCVRAANPELKPDIFSDEGRKALEAFVPVDVNKHLRRFARTMDICHDVAMRSDSGIYFRDKLLGATVLLANLLQMADRSDLLPPVVHAAVRLAEERSTEVLRPHLLILAQLHLLLCGLPSEQRALEITKDYLSKYERGGESAGSRHFRQLIKMLEQQDDST